MNENQNKVAKGNKKDWSQPELRRLDAGSAESQRGSIPDGGGGAQGS